MTGLLALFGFALSVRYDRPSFKVTRGSRLYTGSAGLKAFARACARECRTLGRGVELLPGLAIARDRETRHVLILGSVGGGKTQTMLHLIIPAILRGDGVLVLDTKGDMMAGLPAQPDPLLVALMIGAPSFGMWQPIAALNRTPASWPRASFRPVASRCGRRLRRSPGLIEAVRDCRDEGDGSGLADARKQLTDLLFYLET